jgi:hypothetical protein
VGVRVLDGAGLAGDDKVSAGAGTVRSVAVCGLILGVDLFEVPPSERGFAWAGSGVVALAFSVPGGTGRAEPIGLLSTGRVG